MTLSDINWSRGMKRVTYAFIAFVWIATYAINWNDPARLGEYTVYLLVFAGCVMLLFRALAWVFAGFRKS